MRCRGCGADVRESDRFCNACGTKLATDADAAAATPPDDGSDAAEPRDDHSAPATVPAAEKSDDDHRDDVHESDTTAADQAAPAPDDRETTQSPVTPASFEAPGHGAPAEAPGAEALPAGQPRDHDTDPEVTYQLAALAGGEEGHSSPSSAPSSTQTASSPAAPPAPGGPSEPPPPPAPAATATTAMGTVGPATTTRGPAIGATTTGQVPATYGPVPTSDRRFRFRIVVVAAIIAAGLAVATGITDIIAIETSGGETPLFDIGTWRLNDFGTNNTIAALIAGGLMMLGGFLACFNVRWGGGLAGGAGLALAGWSALVIGLGEVTLSLASAGASSAQVPTTLTRDTGYWLLAAAGGAGIVVFLLSLTVVRRDQAPGLNPWVAAIGAAATLVAVAGPLIPEEDATLEDNWSSATAGIDLPAIFFAGRLAQLGALALAGVIGFLMVRRYGLGLAVGGFSIVTWLAVTSLLERTESPIGPAYANPGAGTYRFPPPPAADALVPHAATIGGIAVAMFCCLVAAVQVILQRRSNR